MDGSGPFPESDMVITTKRVFQSEDTEERQLTLLRHELAPGASKSDAGAVELESAGYTHLYVGYTPHDRAHGVVLHDAKGHEIGPSEKTALACFRGTSVIELLSFWAIILSSVSAAISATALLISVLAFLNV
jgi:hypothetical protein